MVAQSGDKNLFYLNLRTINELYEKKKIGIILSSIYHLFRLQIFSRFSRFFFLVDSFISKNFFNESFNILKFI